MGLFAMCIPYFPNKLYGHIAYARKHPRGLVDAFGRMRYAPTWDVCGIYIPSFIFGLYTMMQKGRTRLIPLHQVHGFVHIGSCVAGCISVLPSVLIGRTVVLVYKDCSPGTLKQQYWFIGTGRTAVVFAYAATVYFGIIRILCFLFNSSENSA